MNQRIAEFLVVFFVKFGEALILRHRAKLKNEDDLKAFEEKIGSAKTARTRQENQDAAKSISSSF